MLYTALTEIFSAAKRGSYADPHTSATVILAAPDETFVKTRNRESWNAKQTANNSQWKKTTPVRFAAGKKYEKHRGR